MTKPDRLSTGFIWLWVILFLGTLLQGCIEVGEQYSAVPPGIWRAELVLSTNPEDYADERSGGVLPFNFEVIYIQPDSFYIVIINGEERLDVRDVQWGHDRVTGKDTLLIDFPVYGSFIRAEFEEDAIEGEWIVPFRGDYSIPFRARHGRKLRFEGVPESPATDLSGRWKAVFSVETDNPSPAIAEFHQEGNAISGTFLKSTGDYRYLDGLVDGNRVFLSTFDGTHAYLFEGKLLGDGSLSGTYRSGKHYKTYWTAVRDSEAVLPDADTIVGKTSKSDPVDFRLPDTEGNLVSPLDPEFAGKPLLIQIMGTWCPNCRDETEFLSKYFREHAQSEIELLAVAFERSDKYDVALPTLRRFKSQFEIEYPVLYGGSLDKNNASRYFPQIDTVLAYPTMLFLDRNKEVRFVYTGFNGPATSLYDRFKADFHNKIQSLVDENE